MTINHFDEPIKNKQKVYEKVVKMSQNSDYTNGNSLDYSTDYIGIVLSRQTDTNIPSQMNFIEKLEKVDEVSMLFYQIQFLV